MLNINSLSVNRNGNEIIKNFSAVLSRGEILCIQGDNGIGKSTLLKAMATIIPYKGLITCNGFNIQDHLEEYCSILLYQPDTPIIDMDFNLRRNLALWAKIHGREETVEAALHSVKLLNRAELKAKLLSRGQLQRLFLARLLVTDANIWILDEPDVYLDDYWRQFLKQLLEMKLSQGGIVIYTSHNNYKISNQKLCSLNEL